MYRLIYREVLIIAHHAILLPIIFLMLGLWPGFLGIFLGIFGLILTVYTAFWVVMVLAILTLRYRDIPPIVGSLMHMAFFATPIIWVTRNLGDFGSWVVALNPFGYFIAIVRDPLLGSDYDIINLFVALGLAIFSTILGLVVLSNTRHRLTYWL